ncbi:hypothetical protein F442_08606 [Phytophthora nicotianae P10297]|uniref:Uncharacterized protein n=1 Tax=Phytophthora nicotianae P10297 TaxID=1317064 RepID=W2ZCZ3_PHYNI|nr:hypothetical protein F442_08606 [Phytophthora nicotianae P10297]
MAREAIVEWLELRQEYKEYTRDRCKNGKEDVSAVMNNRMIKKAIQVNDAGRNLQKGDRSGRAVTKGAPTGGWLHCGVAQNLSQIPLGNPSGK